MSRNEDMNGCLVDVRTCGGTEVRNVVGPVAIVAGNDKDDKDKGKGKGKGGKAARKAREHVPLRFEEQALKHGGGGGAAAAFSGSESLDGGAVERFVVGRFDATLAFCIYFEHSFADKTARTNVDDNVDGKGKGKVSYVQFVSRRATSSGDVSVSVTTHAVPVLSSYEELLSSADVRVAAVLLGKRAVERALRMEETKDGGEAQVDARNAIDATVNGIAAAHKVRRGRTTATAAAAATSTSGASSASTRHATSGSSMEYAFPSELQQLPRTLFHLRQGPLLGNLLQHDDDVACLRYLFLRFSLSESMRLMAPTLTMVTRNAQGEGQPLSFNVRTVPADTLALWDDAVLALDYDAMFVWSGRNRLSSAFDPDRKAALQVLLDRSEGRFPSGAVGYLEEGSSMERFLTARVARTDRDPPEQQIANFPELGAMGEGELQRLRDKFKGHVNNEMSFGAWFWKCQATTFKALNNEKGL